jgi:hypothetical protein
MKILLDYPLSYCVPVHTYTDFILTVPYRLWYGNDIKLINELLVMYMAHLKLNQASLATLFHCLRNTYDKINPMVKLIPIQVYQQSTITVLPDDNISWDFTTRE